MSQLDYSSIDKQKFISFLWHSLHDMAFLDIKRASNGNSKIGAFILASCFIEYIAGFRYGKETQGKDYKDFVRDYFNGSYDPDKLYKDLRCKLVHNYSEGGTYTFTDNHPEWHKAKTNDGRTLLNLEDFISDIENALKTYFDELKTDNNKFKLAVDRYNKLNILGILQMQIIKNGL
jgi:hypothetical protein